MPAALAGPFAPQAQGARAVADIGGSIITGIDGNPLAVLVKQMGLHMADIRSGGFGKAFMYSLCSCELCW